MSAGAIITDEAMLQAIVRDMQHVAVLGIKDDRDPDAPAHAIPAMLEDSGIDVVGVNPMVKSALGRATLGSLAELPTGIDVLDVFRRSDAIPGIADELLALPPMQRPAVVWLQTGIQHDESAARLAAAGYRVVQDRCLGVYARRVRR
ncbi:MAG: CoA-binding protein [Candidatus Eisenbacteria bacterium]|nr:CoA-binding protein [Candidatus Eisenbacteria bacterium]